MDLRSLTAPPDPLTRRERIAVWILAAITALSRWPALSRTLWDWDEALFALALSDYDVVAHHPHPPGFPLFIAAAKLVPLDPFHALQTVTLLSSLLVFPAMFFLARELRASATVAMGAGLLLAFFPNVWFYGGTALSDVPSMVLLLIAAALLLRGCRDDTSLLAGAVVLGIAAGFRPQNLLIGFVPFLLAAFHRRRTALVGAALTAAIVLGAYGAAASLSGGWVPYREALAAHQMYIRATDSFLAPRHPGLLQVADDFFFRPYRAPLINVAVTLLTALALLRRRSWAVVAIFGPFCVFAWLFLDFHSASRFSVAYMPLYAVLVAEGIPRKGRELTLSALLTVMIVWTWPVLRLVHQTESPPFAAMAAARAARPGVTILVDERLAAHAVLLLAGRRPQFVEVRPPFVDDPNVILLREGASDAPGSRTFTRDRSRLASIARPRYFEVALIPGRRPGIRAAQGATAGTESSAATRSSRASRPSSEK